MTAMKSKISPLSLVRNGDPELQQRLTLDDLRRRFDEQGQALVRFALDPRDSSADDEVTFKAFEQGLIPRVFALARTVVMLHLAAAEERLREQLPRRQERQGRTFRMAPAQSRNLATWFGVVRYWRTYMREVAVGRARRGFHPLDVALGLTADRISMTLLSLCVRLATKVSFAEARTMAGWFLPQAPSTEVIEQATLGFGRHTGTWFEQAPAPEGDGEVLVVMIDGKGVPTATDRELALRRGRRRKRSRPKSPRHRGRKDRHRRGKSPRRKKGDKSKNAKMATLVVMYTLRRRGRYLLGPINRWIYGSFAAKKHAFVIARREANKRGFHPDSGKVVQLVTDGDNDLQHYADTFFPEALHTIDIWHVIERLWTAGECIHRERSDELQAWVDQQKDLLYDGDLEALLDRLETHRSMIPKTGPGNKGKRARLQEVINYIRKRKARMSYYELIQADLEISTGPIEGAIKHVVGRRCDHGGMRWIKERAEAVLQLRCIELNGDWDRFVDYVHDTAQQQGLRRGERVRIQQREPASLPQITEEAA